jgi:hypothetical protein
MGELYEDRRQEPRFAASGRYRLQTGRVGEIEGRILDLSLNGALLEHGGSVSLTPGSHHVVSLEFEGLPPFQGDSLLVRVDAQHLGIEFYDMDPVNFAALSSLIDTLARGRRPEPLPCAP